jgi:zinc transport system substrate-binding protein
MRLVKNSAVLLLLIIMILAVTGCNEEEVSENGDRRIIAVSIVPQKTFVEAVCGELADVVVIIPPGRSPENYEPKPIEIERFSKAEIYFTIGVPAEKANILDSALEHKEMKIVYPHEEISKVFDDLEFGPGERDPHIWLSPKRMIMMVEIIAREMSALDPANKDSYERNADGYIDKLKELDEDIKDIVKNLKSRNFIVFHPAFGYLASDYGLTMHSLEEEGKESTPGRLMELIDYAKEEQIKVIFYQAEISGNQAKAFAEEINGEMILLDPLSPDYIENLRKMAEAIAGTMK